MFRKTRIRSRFGRTKPGRDCFMEALEPRLYMSANPLADLEPAAADTVIDRAGVKGSDKLTLRLAGANVELVDRKGTVLMSEPAVSINSVIINGRADAADQLTVDFAFGGPFAVPGGVTFNAGGGKKDDSVIFIGAAAGGVYTLNDAGITAANFALTHTGVERLTINTGEGNDTLNIAGTPAFEKLDIADDGGNDTYDVDIIGGAFKLNDREGDDTYRLTPTGGLSQIKDGKKGLDTIDFLDAANGVNFILQGGEQGIGLGNALVKMSGQYEVVIGSPFADTITGSSKGNLIRGGGGADMLDGGNGKDILIGGGGVDNLLGNGGDDLLIGGGTDLENGNADLAALLEKWDGKGKFEDRLFAVRYPGDLMDTAFLIVGLTLADDGAADQLNGGKGNDFAPWGVGDGTLTDVEDSSAPVLPDFGAAQFSNSLVIDNPLTPLVVGTQFVFEGESEDEVERIVSDVLDVTRTIMGVLTRGVRDTEFVDNVKVEETIDFFAQDDAGNLWYFGEDVTNFEYDRKGNLIGTNNNGGWIAGENGALPGIIMKADPQIGENYFQEFAPLDEALDQAIVTSLTGTATTGLGQFNNLLVTRELSDVDPGALENKLYSAGTGLILIQEDLDDEGVPGFTIELVFAGESTPLKEAKLNIEHNATDLDTGFQGSIDAEGWQRLDVTGPGGELLLTLEAFDQLAELGMTEVFFETVEPENAEVPIAEMLAKLAAGDYMIEGPTVEGGQTRGTALLTHAIPEGPELLTPGEDAVVNEDQPLVLSWNPVAQTIDGDPVTIIAYQLIVEKVTDPHPHMIGKFGLSAYVPSTVTSITIPVGFLEPDTAYAWEVLAIEESGNQTLSSSEFTTGVVAGPPPIEVEDPPNLKEAKLNIEHNATDNDTGFQGFIDSEGWESLEVINPNGDVVLIFEAHGELGELGMTELFFETVEPENADVPIAELLAMLPAGNYTIVGPSMQNGDSGGETSGIALLTHVIPAGPELLTPAEGSTVLSDNLVLSWNPVTQTINGSPVNIIAYQLIVEKDGALDPHMIGQVGLSMYLPATTTSITVPDGILEPGTAYEWEVLAIEESGNQTLSSSEFQTLDV